MKSFSEQVRTVFWRAMTAAVFVIVITVLTGCQTTEPKTIIEVQVQKIEVPRSLLTCSTEPVYGSVTASVKDLMKFVDQMAKALADCSEKDCRGTISKTPA